MKEETEERDRRVLWGFKEEITFKVSFKKMSKTNLADKTRETA